MCLDVAASLQIAKSDSELAMEASTAGWSPAAALPVAKMENLAFESCLLLRRRVSDTEVSSSMPSRHRFLADISCSAASLARAACGW